MQTRDKLRMGSGWRCDSQLNSRTTSTTNIDQLMKHNVITPNLLKPSGLPVIKKKQPKPEGHRLAPEVITDLKVLRMRSVLNSKRFYKRGSINMANDIQVGKIIAGPSDYYSGRLTKRQRKKTLVDELLADQDFRKEVKRRYVDGVTEHKHKFKREYKMLNVNQKKNLKRKNKRKHV